MEDNISMTSYQLSYSQVVYCGSPTAVIVVARLKQVVTGYSPWGYDAGLEKITEWNSPTPEGGHQLSYTHLLHACTFTHTYM